MTRIGTYLSLLVTLFLTCNEKSTANPTETQAPFPSKASFRLVGDGYDDLFEYNQTENLIFCHQYGSELWIRLAVSKFNNGDNSPHIDIDICNFNGAGKYEAMDPQVRPCGPGQIWDIWWHDEPKIYLNQASSSPCDLIIEVEDSIIKGTFSCKDVIRFKGSELMDIEDGYFECPIVVK